MRPPLDDHMIATDGHRIISSLPPDCTRVDDEEEVDTSYISYVTPERIIAHRTRGGLDEYLVRWHNLPYAECSWESEADLGNYPVDLGAFDDDHGRASPAYLGVSRADLGGAVLRAYRERTHASSAEEIALSGPAAEASATGWVKAGMAIEACPTTAGMAGSWCVRLH